ncbi:MAG: EF-P lysine aminoacylase GenX [Verrucomicrobia bacterium]|nr:EF-P lysine aminoacylase GenX [Verrucomicrobiota bacterium]
MNTFLASHKGTIWQRATMFAAARKFFADRGILEVDTNILSTAAPIDAYIDVMKVDMGGGKIGYLHTSPEYELKKLLAQDSGDIYQLSHVYRAGEEGPRHSPEFTMAEWYRVGMDYEPFIEETLEFIRLFLPNLPSEILSYRQAFEQIGKIDYIHDDLTPHLLPFSSSAVDWDRDTQLSLLFSHLVEPHLGQGRLTIITDYPASQASLAKTIIVDGVKVGHRFEIYYDGIELANGFDELTDPIEQRIRLEEENEKRFSLGKEKLPIDEEFIAALYHLPQSCGVAVGFDRLMMLMTSSGALSESVAPR